MRELTRLQKIRDPNKRRSMLSELIDLEPRVADLTNVLFLDAWKQEMTIMFTVCFYT